jgi:hypothetical protein
VAERTERVRTCGAGKAIGVNYLIKKKKKKKKSWEKRPFSTVSPEGTTGPRQLVFTEMQVVSLKTLQTKRGLNRTSGSLGMCCQSWEKRHFCTFCKIEIKRTTELGTELVAVAGTRQVELTNKRNGDWIGQTVAWESAAKVGVKINLHFLANFMPGDHALLAPGPGVSW